MFLKKNINDIVRNVWEWTTEVPQYKNENLIARGASVQSPGSSYLASYRGGNGFATLTVYYDVGFHLVHATAGS